jgi:hypothetical protein
VGGPRWAAGVSTAELRITPGTGRHT